MRIELNVGLLPGQVGGYANVQRVVHYWADTNFNDHTIVLVPGSREHTVVIAGDLQETGPAWWPHLGWMARVHRLAVLTNQDCIACMVGNLGLLIGPRYKDWGPFRREFFFNINEAKALTTMLEKMTAIVPKNDMRQRMEGRPLVDVPAPNASAANVDESGAALIRGVDLGFFPNNAKAYKPTHGGYPS